MSVRILIVDDEAGARNLIVKCLQRLDYDVDTAATVDSAMELMETTEYDIILTDKNMPAPDGGDEGGLDIAKHAHHKMPATQVIMVTGYATLASAIEAMKSGAFDYLTKPFTKKQLCDKIDRALAYRDCINPENTIRIYQRLHSHLLDLLERIGKVKDNELGDLLESLEDETDSLFHAQKEWERLILHQRESLAKIAEWSKELKGAVSGSGKELVDKIIAEAATKG